MWPCAGGIEQFFFSLNKTVRTTNGRLCLDANGEQVGTGGLGNRAIQASGIKLDLY